MEALTQLAHCPTEKCLVCEEMHQKFVISLGVGDSERRPCFAILTRLWTNLLSAPENPRYRTVPLNAGRIKLDLASVNEALDFMATVGWKRKGQELIFEGTDLIHLKLSKTLLDNSEELCHKHQALVAERHKEYLAAEAEKRALDRRPAHNFLYRWKPVAKGPIVKGIKGLKNLGNTCFMNAVLQCLVQTLPLFNLQVPSFDKNQTMDKGEYDPLTKEFCQLFEEMWTVDSFPGRTHDPKGLFGVITRKAPRFALRQQQDAEDFLRCLFDELETEKKKKSFVSKLFEGKLISSVTCDHCGYQSFRNESFIDLSLSIPPPPEVKPGASAASPHGGANPSSPEAAKSTQEDEEAKKEGFAPVNTAITLSSCLDSFIIPETLSIKEGNGVECYSCTRKLWTDSGFQLSSLQSFCPSDEQRYQQSPHSQKPPDSEGVVMSEESDVRYSDEKKKPNFVKRNATKKMMIGTPPKVLIVHLKRFRQTPTGTFEKISGCVTCPKEIDLSPYVNEAKPGVPVKYQLYGFCDHLGGIDGGHYTATVKRLDVCPEVPPAAAPEASTTGEAVGTPLKQEGAAMEIDGGDVEIPMKQPEAPSSSSSPSPIPENWYFFSDEHYHKLEEDKLVTYKAYLLFYSLVE